MNETIYGNDYTSGYNKAKLDILTAIIKSTSIKYSSDKLDMITVVLGLEQYVENERRYREENKKREDAQ